MEQNHDSLHNEARPSTFDNAKYLRHFKTKAENLLWRELRNRKLNNLKFRRQHPYGKYVLDFYCHEKKLCIEVDGNIHDDKLMAQNDIDRTNDLNENGITVIRFKNGEVLQDIKSVLKKISECSLPPSPAREAERG